MEIHRLGNIYGENRGTGFAGNVWDKEKLSPTITTMQGGGREPMIIENMNPRLLGGLGQKWGDKQYRQGNRVYDANGVAMALTAQPLGNCGGNSYMYLTEEKSIVAMRGRNPDNPSDRKTGSPTEQRLEPNSQGICNTLTSVQKDNLVMETIKIKQATKDGYIECKVGGVADLSFPSSTTRRGRVQDNGDTCPTLMSGEQDICKIESQYRIRKLTPRECWRLMDFSDADFEKAAEVNSNTQLYKQAGNSIIRNVLVAILGQLIEGKEDAYRKV